MNSIYAFQIGLTPIAIISSFLLLSLAVIHVYWGFGGLWPGKNKQELIDLVFGKGEQFPSPFMCVFVAIFLFLFSMLPIVWSLRVDLSLDHEMMIGIKLLLAIVSLIFFLRGVLAYFPFIKKQWKPIFVYYTKRIYNPLCLVIAMALLILIL
ncbi:DUF3995 domain-containing protein [Leptospira harrisiae]|uniref:DUF3995 domain-containing protein n=1 Tax=Leptospira harrisiae TaxID=2023189 RepID=A0A2N0AKR7_9LEPT|nr:DUF3995 domain-containing protein [Leptospira harrisiae]PJZ84896.1 hypothetical protein CH364_01045 [Leptospira harrisiae]PKA08399.1 hypothetical protein CH366_01045 [Leptospira harrisiae]